jgi:hypothetical protein
MCLQKSRLNEREPDSYLLDNYCEKEYDPIALLTEGRRPEAFEWRSGVRRLRASFASSHSGGAGAPPGVTRDPCQELADRRFSLVGKRVKQSAARHRINVARRCAERRLCLSNGTRHTRNGPALPGAPSPLTFHNSDASIASRERCRVRAEDLAV